MFIYKHMPEKEFNKELVAFHDEIKRIKNADKTMFAVTEVGNLDGDAMSLYQDFKNIFEYSDPESLSNACLELAVDTFNNAEKNPEKNNIEFMSWMKNKLAAIKATADSFKNGDLNEKEYQFELEFIKEKLAK